MKLSKLLCLAGICCINSGLFADGPVVNVPYAKTAVVLDGRVNEAEWIDSAIIRNIHVFGNGRLAYPTTTVYLKYDGRNLWLGARCFETEKGYPKAHRRQPTDLLSNDDSVQLVLGVSDNVSGDRGVINFGGYAGATGQTVAAADYYYQFTANSAGSISRFFIESALDRPLFEAKTRTLAGEWNVEMRVPFASWGVVNPEGISFPANVFRFRPPDMTAWHLPGFGGYAPMPFGTMTFLPKDQASAKTVEPAVAVSESSNSVRMVNGMPVKDMQTSKLAATLTWYPLSGKVIGRIDLPSDKSAVSAVISVNGAQAIRQELNGSESVDVVALVDDKTRMPAQATLTVFSGSNEVLLTKSVELTAHKAPEWLGTDAGRDYLSAKVPRPWTKPVVDGQRVRLYDKTIGFESCALPSSTVDSLGELFAGAPVVELELDGKPVAIAKGRPALTMDGTSVRVESEQGVVQTRATVEFDGFTTVKMRLRGVDPGDVSRFSVAFPLKKEHAAFVVPGSLQDIQQLTGLGWEGPGGPMWLGNQDKGLWFSFDTPLFLSANRRSQVQVLEKNGVTWLRLNFVDAPGQIHDADHIFRFFLQPTPTKKPSLAKNGLYGGKVALWFENWSDYQGYPDLAKMPEVAKHSAEAHKNGQQQILYFNQMLAENAPGFAEFKSDFLVPPGMMWYKRAYEPGKDVPCYVCCVHGPYGDLLLDGIRKLRDEGGIDGVYMDGTTVPWDCDNPSHIGCDANAPVEWDSNDITRVTGTRNFLKRLRGIFDKTGKQAVMVAHCGGGLDMPTLSLCDSYYEGEQLCRYRPEYSIPNHKFAIGYSGRPWGFRTDLIPQLWIQQTARLLPWSLLHDTQVGWSASGLERKIYAEYSDDATVTYYPYWRSQPHVKKTKGDVLFSYYRKADSTMLIVSNLTWYKQNTVLDLGGLYPAKQISVQDVVSDRHLSLEKGKLPLALDPHGFVALRISIGTVKPIAKEVVKAPERVNLSVDRLDPTQWKFNAADSGVTVARTDIGTRVSSTLYASAATAAFTPGVGPEGTLRINIVRSGRLSVNFAGAVLCFDGGWAPSLRPENAGTFSQPSANPDRPETFVLSWKDGKLDALYGDRPIARGLALAGIGTATNLELATWAGDWFAFDIIRISSRSEGLFKQEQNHPVL